MVLKWPKKAKKVNRKVQKCHKNDEKGPNFAFNTKGPTVHLAKIQQNTTNKRIFESNNEFKIPLINFFNISIHC